ncbi:hypothetical protein GCM10018780_86060 [Streptomyces lanatus]|nr:hypothetical protein GCM10018780_86060 [Streptomyces lanatus]
MTCVLRWPPVGRREVEFYVEDREELLATADEALAKLNRLVENLLDLCRLEAGVLKLNLRATALEEVLPVALADIPDVEVGDVEDFPAVLVDPPLLERVIANLVANAARHSPPGAKALVTASVLVGRAELRIVDRGPGLSWSGRDRLFEPFQRLGDTDNTTGLGLGFALALARGLTEAKSGTITPEDTPGGGLTMVVSLPLAHARGGHGRAGPGRGRWCRVRVVPDMAPVAHAHIGIKAASRTAPPARRTRKGRRKQRVADRTWGSHARPRA